MRWTASAILALTTLALADPEFTKPEAGSNVEGVSIDAVWKDSGDGVALTDLTTFQLALCFGGNDAGEFECQPLTTKEVPFAQGKEILTTASAGWGAHVKNA